MLTTIERVMLFKQVPLFSRIPGEELARIAEVAQQVAFEPNDVLLEMGATCESLLCLIQGDVEIRCARGSTSTASAICTVGEVSLFDRDPSDWSIVARTPVTLLEWNASLFFALLEDRPVLSHGIVAALARRIRAFLATEGGALRGT